MGEADKESAVSLVTQLMTWPTNHQAPDRVKSALFGTLLHFILLAMCSRHTGSPVPPNTEEGRSGGGSGEEVELWRAGADAFLATARTGSPRVVGLPMHVHCEAGRIGGAAGQWQACIARGCAYVGSQKKPSCHQKRPSVWGIEAGATLLEQGHWRWLPTPVCESSTRCVLASPLAHP